MSACAQRRRDVVLRGVSKRFGDKYALRNISITIPEGETTIFVGPNGGGKTTLLKIIAGILKPTAGEVMMPQASIGISFQEPHLFAKLTVRENIAFMMKLMNSYDRERLERILDVFMLREWEDHLAEDLSSGVSKRLDIAIALSYNADIIILDEPLATLDARSSARICEILRKYGKTRIIATHDVDILGNIADNIGVLMGEMIYFGRVPSLDEYIVTIEREHGGEGVSNVLRDAGVSDEESLEEKERENGKEEIKVSSKDDLRALLSGINYEKIRRVEVRRMELSAWVREMIGRKLR